MTLGSTQVTVSGVGLRYPSGQTSILRRLKPVRRGLQAEQHWALSDIDLELKPGDRLGIVGRNGAGKTTLLRVLAGVFEPTTGTIDVRGSVGALLDGGFGLDSHLTGARNAESYALFYGVKRTVRDDFIEGVRDFSGLGDFFYRPIRTYSTGMLTRLIFSLATARQPNILIMDEALATNDASFLDAAAKRFDAWTREASVIVIASHDMAFMRRMCNRGLLLENGRILLQSTVDEVIKEYARSLELSR